MGLKTYGIKYVINDAQARQAMANAKKDLADVNKAALKTATALERVALAAGKHTQAATAAATKGIGDQLTMVDRLTKATTNGAAARVKVEKDAQQKIDVGYYKMAFDGIKLQDRMMKAAEKKASDISGIESKWMARDYKSRVKAEADKLKLDDFARSRTEKAIRDRETLEQSYLVRDYKSRVAAEKRKESAALGANGRLAGVTRRQLTEEQMARTAFNRHMDSAHQKRIAQIQAERFGTRSSFVEAIAGATNFDHAISGVGLAMTGLAVGKTVLSAIVEKFVEADKAAYGAGQMVQDYRKALLELAALKGQLGNTTQTMGEELITRSKTLQTAEDSRRFTEAALGVGESTIDKPGAPALISPEEAKKARVFGGAFQAAEGGDATTHGKLIGLMPQLIGHRTTGDEVARKEAQLYNIFKPGGVSFTKLTDQYSKAVAPYVASKSLDAMQGGALLSAFSTTNTEAPGTEVGQFMRATLGGIDRTGKPRVKGGEPIGKYYESLGINADLLKKTKPGDMPFVIAEKVKNDLVTQEQASKAKGEEFNRLNYLQHKGFGNLEDRQALAHYIGMSESGQMSKFMDLAKPEALPTMAQAFAPVIKAQNTEPALQGRKAELSDQLAKTTIGAGKEEYIANLEKVAFNRLKAQGQVSGEFSEDVMNAGWRRGVGSGFGETLFRYRAQTEEEASRMLLGEAQRRKVPLKKGETYKQLMFEANHAVPLSRDRMFELGGQIQKAGGTGVPGMGDLTSSATGALITSAQFEGNVQAMKELGKQLEESNRLKREELKRVPVMAPAPAPLQSPLRPAVPGR